MLTGLSDASYPRALEIYFIATPMGTIVPLKLGLAQNSAHASISLRRFSNRSPRR
jgi:hypothetical protein